MSTKASVNTPVKLCDDGKYRWVYAKNLFTDPSIFFLIWKIFFFIILGLFIVMNVADLLNWGKFDIIKNLPILIYLLLGMTALTGLGYLVYAAIMGGKYAVEFEMDENGVTHRQIALQAEKAKKLGQTTVIGGAAAGSFTAVGAGINAQRTEMYSDFARVKKVKAYPRSNTIKVNAPFNHNQVYASKEDFEFIKDFIISHCGNLK